MMVSFPMLPPEINSLRMFSGAGSAPMLQARRHGAGWPKRTLSSP
ncbi:MAG: hypothetical protein CK429_35460, partial [Mycobacterium sp.]